MVWVSSQMFPFLTDHFDASGLLLQTTTLVRRWHKPGRLGEPGMHSFFRHPGQGPETRVPPGILSTALREFFRSSELKRCPEPEGMESNQSVQAFHVEGEQGSLVPVYHFNALAIGYLVPQNGVLLDLGSGSGQFLAYLARIRPDLRIIGLELSSEMVRAGQALLGRHGLRNRVELRQGDMKSFAARISEPIDAVCSMYALHHLPTRKDVEACLGEIAQVRQRTGCAVWLYDLARPKRMRTVDEVPMLFSPNAPQTFNQDLHNSLMAAFSFRELSTLLDHSDLGPFRHIRSSFLGLFQAHVLRGTSTYSERPPGTLSRSGLAGKARRDFLTLRFLFRGIPLQK